jgi:hypothetical protein
VGTTVSFPVGKAAGREADHLPPSSVEVKNAWSYTFTPRIRLHGVVLSWSTGITLPFTAICIHGVFSLSTGTTLPL